MATVFLICFAVILIIILITKFSKTKRLKQNLKRVQVEDHHASSNLQPGHLRVIFEVSKILYHRYIEGIPNYEALQRGIASLENNFRFKLPMGSTEYDATVDPVKAKRIMSDPLWTERVPVGHYIQDAAFHKPYGLIFGGGKYYKPASRITTKLLQQLGFFNPITMEGRFGFEMEELQRKFAAEIDLNGGEHTFCPRDIFGYLSINVVFYILLGKRNPFDQALVTKLIHTIFTTNKRLSPMVSLLDVIPFLRHFPKLTFMGDLIETSDMVYDVFREVIADKRRVGKYKEHVEDFIDGMLQHVDKSENLENGLNEENMLVVLRDMLFAGADTSSATLEHALLFMALRPEVQEKVQAEIDTIIGPDSVPSYEDRRRMPYTEATLHEIYRLGSPVPGSGRARYTGGEWSFAPMTLYGIHRNELFFDEPNEFNPERFLDKEDPTKVVNTGNVMAFGNGRRSCPGETAARVAVFVYFVGMLQKYSIKLSSEHPSPSMKNTHGISRSPERYYVTIQRR